MAYVAVHKRGGEAIFTNKPVRVNAEYHCGYWRDDELYWENRGYTTNPSDESIDLPKGSIKKLIGRELTWNDEPVELK